MKYGKKFLTIIFVMFLLGVGLTYEASAQRRVVRRPVIVRTYVYRDPFWRSRYYDPFYSSFYSSPYRRYQEQRYYLQRELAGNQRELAEHLRKYRADGVITAKEQRELNDDYKDVRNSREKLRRFTRYY
jgi:DNA-binding LacI/PurR family transcriptional regulator